jgi:hypothetical protein
MVEVSGKHDVRARVYPAKTRASAITLFLKHHHEGVLTSEACRLVAMELGISSPGTVRRWVYNSPLPRDSPQSLDQLELVLMRNNADRERRNRRDREATIIGRTLYSDSEGRPILRDSFAGYLDELGTSDRLATLTEKALRDDLARYDKTRPTLSNPDNNSELYVRTLYFTDNVVIAMPLWDGGRRHDSGLSMMLAIVGRYQLSLALEGRFLRGGIARGPLYCDASFATGKAHLDAVLLEEHRAVVPRVLVNESALAMAQAEVDEYWFAPHSLDVENWLDSDGDGVFVSYLNDLMEDDSPWPLGAALEAHRRTIQTRLSEFKNNQRVRTKYEWVAGYHNYFVRKVDQLEYAVELEPGSERFGQGLRRNQPD